VTGNETLMVMAVIGGHLAHPAPLQNSYCNGLVQPSLIMNHHVDCQEDIHPILATNISEYTSRLKVTNKAQKKVNPLRKVSCS
jgi:hypothetical protein